VTNAPRSKEHLQGNESLRDKLDFFSPSTGEIWAHYLLEKSAIKRDGPVFFSSSPVKVVGDERTIMAIVAPHRGETSPPDT
jgi:hypothetical protein